MCSKFGEQAGMTNEQMKEYCTKVFPTLKRWKKHNTPNAKKYRDYILEQLSEVPNTSYYPIMD